MSFETITITRQYPVVNGFVQTPPNRDRTTALAAPITKTAASVDDYLTDHPTATQVFLSMGSGPMRGGKNGAQSFIELPAVLAGESYIDAGLSEFA